MRRDQPTTAGFLYTDTGGDGPVVVLLHGVLINGSLWNGVGDGCCGGGNPTPYRMHAA